ncbi:recombinase [Bacillus cereus]|nr:recombinase [Bacillus cereus]PEY13850.1 recombinase [Bacillus cereus]
MEATFPKWKNREITGVQFMDLLELKKYTFYKTLKEYKENKVAANL